MVSSFSQTRPLWRSRQIVNTVYFFAPPLGLLFMFFSPLYTARERLWRTAITATFIAFFVALGPDLHHYLDTEIARLASAQGI